MHSKKHEDTLGWHWDNSYTHLPETFFKQVKPATVPEPTLLCLNHRLAKALGLSFENIAVERIANMLSGKALPLGTSPIAQAYAGHQFGHFTMLGDGRAILIGEHLTPAGQRFDIQLKGAGQTPYSRRGDGKSTLRAALREYIISECMYALGIPSSGSLAVVSTGEQVYREQVHQGAVLTRVMQSHIRIGTFEYARHFLSLTDLQALVHYTIQRHFPLLKESPNPALDLLQEVMQRQITLITHWMRVGFIHGVMNTDNMSIAGETFDYGPCAFMNSYHPDTVFSSIDTQGRYAYGNQPRIALWNIACLAGALLPLIHKDENEAIEQVKSVLDGFEFAYDRSWLAMMGHKLGLPSISVQDRPLVLRLLDWMQTYEADFTNTFLHIMGDLIQDESHYRSEAFSSWLEDWNNLRSATGIDWDKSLELMRSVNPQIIPRNHIVEAALDAATMNGDFSFINQLLKAMQTSYSADENHKSYQNIQKGVDNGYQTFCGT